MNLHIYMMTNSPAQRYSTFCTRQRHSTKEQSLHPVICAYVKSRHSQASRHQPHIMQQQYIKTPPLLSYLAAGDCAQHVTAKVEYQVGQLRGNGGLNPEFTTPAITWILLSPGNAICPLQSSYTIDRQNMSSWSGPAHLLIADEWHCQLCDKQRGDKQAWADGVGLWDKLYNTCLSQHVRPKVRLT